MVQGSRWDRAGQRKVARTSAGLAGALCLAACSTVSLAPSAPVAAAPRPAPVATSAARPPLAAPSGLRPADGIGSRRPLPAEVEPPLPAPPPIPPAVARQYPGPSVAFATPAFAPGRKAFTNQAELHALLQDLAARAPRSAGDTRVDRLDAGESQAGRPIEAIVFTRPPADPVPTDAPTRRPTIVLVAGQHGDEPAGSEALLVIAQQLAAGRLDGVLKEYDVVVLPRANPDGAATFRRLADDGSDVNRDHLLLVTPEAQAQAWVLKTYAPSLVVDLHEYPVAAFVERFDAWPRADAMLDVATVADLPPFIAKAAEEWFRLPLVAALRVDAVSSDWYYTVPADPADRSLSMGGIGAQIGRNAAGLRNAVSVLVESRGGGFARVDLARRVQTQVLAVRSLLASAVLHAADLAKVRQYVERETVSLACRSEVLIEAAQTPAELSLPMLDGTTGALRNVTVAGRSSLALRPLKSRPRPCGYWLAAGAGDAVRRLRLLGIEVSQLDESGEMRVETYRELGRESLAGPNGAPGEPGASTRLRVQTTQSLLDVPAGSYYVGLDQPLGRLAVAVLEPEAPAGYAANGVIAAVGDEARVLLRPQVRMTSVP